MSQQHASVQASGSSKHPRISAPAADRTRDRALWASGRLDRSALLRLQRLVGNRTVSRLVQTNEPSAPVHVQRLFGRNMRARIKANEYANLDAIVEKAESGNATPEELNKAMQKVERYKQAAAKMKGVDVAERLDTLRVLGDDLAIALDRLRVRDSRSKAKDTYLGEARSGGMKALTESAEGYFKKGRAPRLAATEHGLDQAESGALSAYTANEFQYINPATAFDKPWMQSQEKTKMMKGTEKERFEEGSLHGAMMMEAMAKLPVWTGEGFRGERLTPTQFEEQYTEDGSTVTAKQSTQVKAQFWSVSTDRSTAESFATNASIPEATISMLYIIKVGNARDLQAFSLNPDEDEVLCPAGSKVTVTKVEKQRSGSKGQPAATAWYHVYLSQT